MLFWKVSGLTVARTAGAASVLAGGWGIPPPQHTRGLRECGHFDFMCSVLALSSHLKGYISFIHDKVCLFSF